MGAWMRELMTTLLDTVGLCLVAAGACAAAYPVVGWAGLMLSGVVVLVGSWLATRQGGP